MTTHVSHSYSAEALALCKLMYCALPTAGQLMQAEHFLRGFHARHAAPPGPSLPDLSKLQRYSLEWNTQMRMGEYVQDMEKDRDGEWVRHEDVTALFATSSPE
jgi:hypothetical protein